jgi:hypothetical protein
LSRSPSALDALTLTGNGNIVVDGSDREFEVSLLGNGIHRKRNATRLDVTVGGSGTVQFTRLVADDVRALVSGSGTSSSPQPRASMPPCPDPEQSSTPGIRRA